MPVPELLMNDAASSSKSGPYLTPQVKPVGK